LEPKEASVSKKKIDKVERYRVMSYVSEVMPLLGISDCEIILSKETCNSEENDADISHVPDTKRHYLRLSEDWMSFGDKHKTIVLLHEMLHVVTTPLCQAANPDAMVEGQRLWFNTTEEITVDGLACALRPLMPQYPGSGHSISPHVHLGTKTGI
jgi:hypothetical protein